MENRRRRRRMKSDEDSEDQSYSESASLSEAEAEDDKEVTSQLSERLNIVAKNLESEYESAEEDGIRDPEKKRMVKLAKSELEDFVSPSEFIDEEGGEEDTAHIEAGGEFLEGSVLDLSDDYEEVCVEEERQQGDGEECSTSSTPEKILDYDEDKRNPQYIPKKGTFYEHDDRNNEVVKEKEVDISREKKKKKLWLDEGKWGHDRYREEEQFPKSREELIEIYGYDIRNEDGPPRARRRRRYGRGPTKYQRHWEDENAYGKERSNVNHGFGGNRSRGRSRAYIGSRGRPGFCCKVISKDDDINESQNNVNCASIYSKNSKISKESIEENINLEEKCFDSSIIDDNDFPALPKQQGSGLNELTIEENIKSTPVSEEPVEDLVRTQTFENSSLTNNPQIFKEHSSRQGRNLPSRSCFKNTYKRPCVRSQRDNCRSSCKDENEASAHDFDKKNDLISLLNFGMQKLSFSNKEVSDDVHNTVSGTDEKSRPLARNQSNGSNQSNCNLPQSSRSGNDASSRPKRYSSLRQRGLTEAQSYHTSTPHLAPPHATFFDSSFQTVYTTPDGVAPSNTQSQTSGSPPLINTAYQNFASSHFPDGYGMRMPVNSAPRLFPQVTLPTVQPVLATQCITPNANVMNFTAPPHPQPAGYSPFTYQQYSTPPPPPSGSQPPDLYGPGITYYYTQGQPHPIRSVPQKRPKAAIPILPPPENEVKFSSTKSQEQPNGPC